MSGFQSLYQAPEYYIGVKIADSLKLELPKYNIRFETNVADVLEAAGSHHKARNNQNLRPNGRFDIVVFNSDEEPVYVFEIKHKLYNLSGNFEDDIKRLHFALPRGETIKRAIFVYWTGADTNNRRPALNIIKDTHNNISKFVKNEYNDHNPLISIGKTYEYPGDDESPDWAWSSGVIVF